MSDFYGAHIKASPAVQQNNLMHKYDIMKAGPRRVVYVVMPLITVHVMTARNQTETSSPEPGLSGKKINMTGDKFDG